MEISRMTVKGKGFASAPPDAIAISLQLEGTKDTYELAMQHAALALEQVRETLLPLGFPKRRFAPHIFRSTARMSTGTTSAAKTSATSSVTATGTT